MCNTRYPLCLIVIDIGGTKMASALAYYNSSDSAPKLINKQRCPTLAAEGGQAVLNRVVSIVEDQLSYAEAHNIKISGVGIDTAGIVNTDDGSIFYASDIMPGWTNKNPATTVQNIFNIPCAVIGDVQAFCLGEVRWGAAKNYPSALMVAAGTGLGGAFSVDGKVVLGARGAAGHIGHTHHGGAGKLKCSCGLFGHIENLASGTGIGALYQGTSPFEDDFDPSKDGLYVSQQAQAGDAHAIHTLQTSGEALGEAIGSWTNLLDPHIIIVSGSVLKAGPIWTESLKVGFKRQVLAFLADTPLVEAQLGDNAPLIGAAENFLDQLKANNQGA